MFVSLWEPLPDRVLNLYTWFNYLCKVSEWGCSRVVGSFIILNSSTSPNHCINKWSLIFWYWFFSQSIQVLDMRALPGAKSIQLLELLHGDNSALPSKLFKISSFVNSYLKTIVSDWFITWHFKARDCLYCRVLIEFSYINISLIILYYYTLEPRSL